MNAKPSGTQLEIEGFTPVDLYQKREKIITRHVGGRFQRLRFYTGWPLLVGYLATPWLMWGERQAVLFDLPARQFHILGLSFWPQDLWLLGWLLMISAFALFTVTNVVGRLWCGYTCPQTVWTAIFMWIEQKTEGTRNQRIRLDRMPMNFEKLRKRGTKHALWLGWAAITGVTFVGYFTPIRELTWQIATFEIATLNGWIIFWSLFFTAATYINAGWMREQVCLYMCPYARFQSAMIDRDTLIVSYDPARGEPRGSRKRGQDAPDQQGDCIDCQMCVQVCPTGIDIRDGLQYQCIGCAHCIDACNEVMTKMGSSEDLISYTTLNALDGGKVRWLRPRSAGYALVCLLIALGFAGALVMRSPMDLDILRDRGSLYVERDNGSVVNEYQLKLMNKSTQPGEYQLRVVSPAWLEIDSATRFSVAPGELLDIPLTLATQAAQATTAVTIVELCLVTTPRCIREETRFIAPQSTAVGRS